MTSDQISGVAQIYAAKFDRQGIPAGKCSVSPAAASPDADQTLAHAHWMCLEIPRLLGTEDGFEKANRWLGFIQGVLWAAGSHSIDEMRSHNKPNLIPA